MLLVVAPVHTAGRRVGSEALGAAFCKSPYSAGAELGSRQPPAWGALNAPFTSSAATLQIAPDLGEGEEGPRAEPGLLPEPLKVL